MHAMILTILSKTSHGEIVCELTQLHYARWLGLQRKRDEVAPALVVRIEFNHRELPWRQGRTEQYVV